MIKSTFDLIKILPFEEKFKIDLINRYPGLTDDQKIMIENVVWDLYRNVYKLKLQENLKKELLRQEQENLPPDPDTLKKMREQTEKELEKDLEVKADQVDIAAVRTKLQSLINEKKTN